MSVTGTIGPPAPGDTAIRRLIAINPLPDLVEAWLDDRRTVGRGLASRTEAAYRSDLTSWGRALADVLSRPIPPMDSKLNGVGAMRHVLGQIELDDLTAGNVRAAQANLYRQEYAPSSRGRMLTSLRGFCRWLVIGGHLAADPTITLTRPSIPDSLPSAFLRSELEAIVEVASKADPSARHPWPERDRALVAILAGAGLRAAELIGLRVADVIRDEQVVLRVTGKGRKQRLVPIPSEVVSAIDTYLAERQRKFRNYEPTDPLMIRHNGRPMSTGTLNYLVLRWVKRAGVVKPEGEVAHAFRHTYAKGLVLAGVPLSSVQALLGHADLTTTQIYLRMTGVELAGAVQSAEVREYLRTYSVDPTKGA